MTPLVTHDTAGCDAKLRSDSKGSYDAQAPDTAPGLIHDKISKHPPLKDLVDTIRDYRQYRVHCVGATLPILFRLGYWAIVLGILKVQALSSKFNLVLNGRPH